jgi:hypothetical protein
MLCSTYLTVATSQAEVVATCRSRLYLREPTSLSANAIQKILCATSVRGSML